jgi:SH3-like domain-containing protein
MGTELICLEPKATAKAKLGVNGQWINVQDPRGDQGYVAAWYVSESKDKPATPTTPASAPVSTTTPASKPASVSTSAPVTTAKPIPAGALALLPIEELSFRTQPVISPETLIRRIPITEQLICVEPANLAIPKVGVTGQWLKVRDASNKEGYVAAWYVKYASGSTAQQTAANAPGFVMGGPLRVKATVEGIALRKQPIVSDATLIKRLPLGTVFIVTEQNAEGKVGMNDQWLKVKDPTGTEGLVAAWFVARA